jgi:uncharacterized damage-inducible protein DinB
MALVEWGLASLDTKAQPRHKLGSRIASGEEWHGEETFGEGIVLGLLEHQVVRSQAPPEGIWQGYDGEWRHVSRQLITLAEATPPEKFAWRPAAGVRSTSEVYMHIAIANLYLLSVIGPKMPPNLKLDMETKVTSKADVIGWLQRSLDAVKEAHLAENPKDLERKVHIADRDATVDGMDLRIIIHANEHMGQLIAYARMTGVAPPWAAK